jgi:hypothetical protein
MIRISENKLFKVSLTLKQFLNIITIHNQHPHFTILHVRRITHWGGPDKGPKGLLIKTLSHPEVGYDLTSPWKCLSLASLPSLV